MTELPVTKDSLMALLREDCTRLIRNRKHLDDLWNELADSRIELRLKVQTLREKTSANLYAALSLMLKVEDTPYSDVVDALISYADRHAMEEKEREERSGAEQTSLEL